VFPLLVLADLFLVCCQIKKMHNPILGFISQFCAG
jgi:hypothetical protein